MAEETQTTEAPAEESQTQTETAPPEVKAETPDRPEQNLKHELERRTEKQREAEKTAKELAKRVEELEDKDKSEVERATKRAEKAEQEASELTSRTKKLERGGWIRNAATEAKFADPEDAVAFADLDEIESEKDADQFVKTLAKRKDHLLRAESETPQIGKVIDNGKRTNGTGEEKAPNFAEQDAAAVTAELQKIGVLPS